MKTPLSLFTTIEWHQDHVILLDQQQLPTSEVYLKISDYNELCNAIKNLNVRGAPAIGIAGAFALALAACHSQTTTVDELLQELQINAKKIIATRPTAVNLEWAVNKVLQFIANHPQKTRADLVKNIVECAQKIHEQDIHTNKKIGVNGTTIINNDDIILTHCNAGALATAGFGTALGIFYTAQTQGKKFSVIVDETRPILQGSRLTARELCKAGIDTTLICDNMAASLMSQKKISKVIVGADRITANGDTANKIGTYGLAVLAHYHQVPFYIAAPLSTIDFNMSSGSLIVIEERDKNEVTYVAGTQVAPESVKVFNPAFDVTPHSLITGIITEAGILNPTKLHQLR